MPVWSLLKQVRSICSYYKLPPITIYTPLRPPIGDNEKGREQTTLGACPLWREITIVGRRAEGGKLAAKRGMTTSHGTWASKRGNDHGTRITGGGTECTVKGKS